MNSRSVFFRHIQNHRTVWVGRDLIGHLVQRPAMGRDTFHYTRLLKVPFNLALNASRQGTSTASLGNLFQCLTTLIVKTLFITSNINQPSFSLKPLPLVLSLHALVQSPSPAFLQASSGTRRLQLGLPEAFSSTA